MRAPRRLPVALITGAGRDEGLGAAVARRLAADGWDVATSDLSGTAASFDRHVAVNARASLLLIAAFARQAPAAGGAIVAFTGDHTTGNLPYGASKGALDRIVISAARELGTRNISANVLTPAPSTPAGWTTPPARRSRPSTRRAPGGARRRRGRRGLPRHARRRWITGRLLHADGGFSAPL